MMKERCDFRIVKIENCRCPVHLLDTSPSFPNLFEALSGAQAAGFHFRVVGEEFDVAAKLRHAISSTFIFPDVRGSVLMYRDECAVICIRNGTLAMVARQERKCLTNDASFDFIMGEIRPLNECLFPRSAAANLHSPLEKN